jgi:tryptophanyl-tRNA synthetase
LNKKVEKVKVREIVLQGIKYVYDPDESKFENRNYYMVYDYATFNNKKELLEVARLYKNGDKGYRLIKI